MGSQEEEGLVGRRRRSGGDQRRTAMDLARTRQKFTFESSVDLYYEDTFHPDWTDNLFLPAHLLSNNETVSEE